MEKNKIHILAKDIIKESGWKNIVSMLMDVLKINMFVVDAEGHMVMPPKTNKYGGRFLVDDNLGFGFPYDSTDAVNNFEEKGYFLESINNYHLHTYAIPIYSFEEEQNVAFFIVGPVVLNKQLTEQQYRYAAEEKGFDAESVIAEINELRIISNITMRSTLRLINEIVDNHAKLYFKSSEKSLIESLQEHSRIYDENVFDTVVPKDDRKNRLLGLFLEVALKIADTECGSVMTLNDAKDTLSISASRGMNKDVVSSVRVRLGEGIAGLAAKERSSFLLNDESSSNNRIGPLLKRPEIKKALVMPLISDDAVFGVLNLHTKKRDAKEDFNVDALNSLSGLLSAAL